MGTFSFALSRQGHGQLVLRWPPRQSGQCIWRNAWVRRVGVLEDVNGRPVWVGKSIAGIGILAMFWLKEGLSMGSCCMIWKFVTPI